MHNRGFSSVDSPISKIGQNIEQINTKFTEWENEFIKRAELA